MAQSPKYELVWAEEFEGSEIDTGTWNFEKGFSKNNEQQFYTSRPENVRVENGFLVIEAHSENYDDASYTSSRINTLNKMEFRYGRIEVRAKLPEGKGTWPAIWMLGTNHLTAGYPACGEIDIMEFVGKAPGAVHGAIHYPVSRDNKINSSAEEVSLPESIDSFHTYSIEWDRSRINFFVDGQKYHSFKVGEANRWGRKNIFRKPFYLILNLALGGNWAGEIDDSALPAQFYVDYIRYYR